MKNKIRNMLTDHQKQSIREAEARLRNRKNSSDWGDFIKKLAKWHWFATITLRNARNRDRARAMLFSYLNALERAAGGRIAWFFRPGIRQIGETAPLPFGDRQCCSPRQKIVATEG